MNKFADDTKLGHRVLTEEDRIVLQSCLNSLVDWASTWCMEFNVAKCKVLHAGRENKEFNYSMKGLSLVEISQERDIGELINKNLKPSSQCAEAARRAILYLVNCQELFFTETV